MTEQTKTGDRLLDLLYQELADLSVRMSQVKDMIATKQDGRPPDPEVLFPYYGKDAGDIVIAFLEEMGVPQTFEQINRGCAERGFKFAKRQPDLQLPNAIRALIRFNKVNAPVWIEGELVGLADWPKP